MTTEVQTVTTTEQAEIQTLAEAMATAYRKTVDYYMNQCRLSRKEAREQADVVLDRDARVEQIKQTPARQVSWMQMSELARHDPQAALKTWEAIKAEARIHLDSGMLPADALTDSSPWQRAKFYALRENLAADWQPSNGIEQCLIDQMALCFMRFLEWNAALSHWASVEEYGNDPNSLPRITTDEALARSAEMIDRFNRLFLRTLRALRDLRRYNAPVIVQNAGQVNVGGQQVNVAETKESVTNASAP